MIGASANDDEEEATVVEVADNLLVRLFTAEDDCNAQKKTLFATFVWSGSTVLARELALMRSEVANARVIEFGAAAGLPSITAAKLGASFVCATDFPSPTVLENLSRNIAENGVSGNTVVKPHIWGESTADLLEAASGNRFDIALAAECLWRHECHPVLLQSALNTLRPGGLLLIAYSHHIPGLEAADDQFVSLCKQSGFSIVSSKTASGKHMWSDRVVDIFFVALRLDCELAQL